MNFSCILHFSITQILLAKFSNFPISVTKTGLSVNTCLLCLIFQFISVTKFKHPLSTLCTITNVSEYDVLILKQNFCRLIINSFVISNVATGSIKCSRKIIQSFAENRIFELRWKHNTFVCLVQRLSRDLVVYEFEPLCALLDGKYFKVIDTCDKGLLRAKYQLLGLGDTSMHHKISK